MLFWDLWREIVIVLVVIVIVVTVGLEDWFSVFFRKLFTKKHYFEMNASKYAAEIQLEIPTVYYHWRSG